MALLHAQRQTALGGRDWNVWGGSHPAVSRFIVATRVFTKFQAHVPLSVPTLASISFIFFCFKQQGQILIMNILSQQGKESHVN